ncbi:tRNA-uridine aminocarboxypropyltransferase [Flocculibacter collagenilyticus]|uniref:tRNA-uridine aminocarboxypropyltransferase n=1 Tax=Flocculibacter collagenilyticus TaxID=2744479 RepID=UPI0018F3270E|nr:tRNA-uridine aminocarboxypropyltransferase [Flocculibacter collagenilyticus]
MSNRKICTHCQFPLKVCICASIKPIFNKTRLFILQHPSEVNVAKNTGRLILLCSNNAEITVGETENDFEDAKSLLLDQKDETVLIYPESHSTDISELSYGERIKIKNIILVDSTWKKAHKILQLNPWLTQFATINLNSAEPTQYTIRKANKASSLSTIEAAAYCIHTLEGIDTSPLTDCLNAMVKGQLSNMPVDVKQRYDNH